jgi:hypothetical protein
MGKQRNYLSFLFLSLSLSPFLFACLQPLTRINCRQLHSVNHVCLVAGQKEQKIALERVVKDYFIEKK